MRSMPKKADHDARRREIVEALWRITARGGLDAATIREIAAEAGCSVRPVQYYFRNKAELMAAAHELVAQRLGERVTRAVQALGPDAEPRAIVEAIARSFLPTDAEARECMQLFFAFYAVELTDAAMRIPAARGVPNAL